MIEAKSSCQFNPGNFSFPKKENVCPECNSTKISKDIYRGEITCDNCGLVISDNIQDDTPRGLSSSKEDGGKRNPVTIMHHDKGLSSYIGRENRDANGRDLSPSKISEFHRLRKWDKRFKVTNARDRHLSFALNQIQTVCPQLGLPSSIAEGAAFIYRKALSKNLVLGRSIESVARACIYIACRQAKFPKCLDELILTSDCIDKREISKTYRLLARELELAVPLIGPCEYLPKISSNLALPFNVTNKAKEILQAAISNGLASGRNPMSMCAAVIYIASRMENYPIKQKDIASASNVTDMTLRARYNEIIEKLGIII